MDSTPPACAPSSRIVRILAVRDTREWVEEGDRWIPLSGTGTSRACDRCGRDHEVHVEVELADGATALIGRGCARGDSMEAAVRASVSAEQTRARLARQLDAARARRAAAAAAWAAVSSLPLPDARLVEERPDEHGRSPLQIYGMGDAGECVVVYCRHEGLTDERRRCLVDSWRRARYAERGDVPRGPGGYPLLPGSLDGSVRDLEDRLDKVARKLVRLAEPAAPAS